MLICKLVHRCDCNIQPAGNCLPVSFLDDVGQPLVDAGYCLCHSQRKLSSGAAWLWGLSLRVCPAASLSALKIFLRLLPASGDSGSTRPLIQLTRRVVVLQNQAPQWEAALSFTHLCIGLSTGLTKCALVVG